MVLGWVYSLALEPGMAAAYVVSFASGWFLVIPFFIVAFALPSIGISFAIYLTVGRAGVSTWLWGGTFGALAWLIVAWVAVFVASTDVESLLPAVLIVAIAGWCFGLGSALIGVDRIR